MKIVYIKHEDIDKEKWDRCIDTASNGLIYACSCYLDIMSKGWDALVMNDYEAVMPLTWNKKYGIPYLRQPAFTQQLGIFGNILFNDDVTSVFISKALGQFPFMEINLNFANEFKKATAGKCNLILSLNRPFWEIEKSFRKDFVKKIKEQHLVYTSSGEVEKAVLLFKEHYSTRLRVPQKAYADWIELCTLLKSKKQVLMRRVSAPDKRLLAIALFLKDKRRIYYVMSITLPEGRKSQANYFLLYHLIKEFAGQNLIFDFEGSEIPSVNSFFKKFGAVEQPYSFVRINHLSPWKKGLKRIYDYYQALPK